MFYTRKNSWTLYKWGTHFKVTEHHYDPYNTMFALIMGGKVVVRKWTTILMNGWSNGNWSSSFSGRIVFVCW